MKDKGEKIEHRFENSNHCLNCGLTRMQALDNECKPMVGA